MVATAPGEREGPVRIVLGNDDRIILEGLRAMLAPHGDRVRVVGVAQGDPEIDLAPLLAEEPPDVVLIDAFGRLGAGIDAAGRLAGKHPDLAVAVFTAADDTRLLLQALRAGVRGYLLKSIDDLDLVDALVRLGSGQIVIDPELATETALLASQMLDVGSHPGAHLGLTRRESELLLLYVEGLTPGQAARRLEVSEATVRTHTRNFYRKLGVGDRAAAVALAMREGLAR
jgi:DNA-binding NarL/FixJ family response regulator